MASIFGKEILYEDGENLDTEGLNSYVNRQNADIDLKVGLLAHSDDEAYRIYNDYASLKGFSVRKGNYGYSKRNGQVNRRTFLCSCEGFREDNTPLIDKKTFRLDTRTGCNARAVFKIENGVYELTQHNAEHNHPFAKPEQRHLIRSNRRVHDTSGSVMKSMMDSGIRATKVYNYMVRESGGYENVGFTITDCHNYLQAQKQNLIEAGDSQSLMNLFKQKNQENPMFFYTVQVDEQNRMTNFFWRDASSKMDYECFGDVVIFDTTYRTNKYNMVCAPFVGVNHHWKNVLFGCAFLLDETIPSFVWLFDAFLGPMGDKHPKTIFTDQDAAMANAIAKVFPNTQHRLCQWHIAKNATQNIGHLYGKPAFRDKFTGLLYGCETEDEFESSWKEMVEEWGVSGNSWLSKLYNLCGKWSPAFSRETFSANIRSTQRSESTNNVFQGMACKAMSLTKFVYHYEENAEKMREAENTDDYDCTRGKPRILIPDCGILKHACKVYTNTIFGMFQDEYLAGVAMEYKHCGTSGTVQVYGVRKGGRTSEHIVQFNTSDLSIQCSCKTFESLGWLCSHTLRVLNMCTIKSIPMQYILKRWTKGEKLGIVVHDSGSLSQRNPKSSKTIRFNMLMREAFSVMGISSFDDTTVEIARANLRLTVDQVGKYKATLNREDSVNAIDGDGGVSLSADDTQLLDPPRVRPKGTTYGRRKSFLEKRKRKASKKTSKGGSSDPSHAPVCSQQKSPLFYPPSNPFGTQLDANYNQNFPFLQTPIARFDANTGPLPTPMIGYHNTHFSSSAQTNMSMPNFSHSSSNSVMGTHISHFPNYIQDGTSWRFQEFSDDKR